MKKMVETGIPLRKGIAMGMHDEMYPGGREEAYASNPAEASRKMSPRRRDTTLDRGETGPKRKGGY